MYLRKSGTKRPYYEEGSGTSRRLTTATPERGSGARLCLAIVTLLFCCVLMAGAVSAEDYFVNNAGGGAGGSETDPSNLSSVLTAIEGKTGGTHTINLLADTYSFQQSGGATNYLYINQSKDKNIVLQGPSSGKAVIKGQFVVLGYTTEPAMEYLIFQNLNFDVSEGVDGFYIHPGTNGSILSPSQSKQGPQNILIQDCEFVGYQDLTYALVTRTGGEPKNVTMDKCRVTGGRGAVDAYAYNLTVSNSVLSSNSVSSYSMGVNFMGGSNLTVVNNSITAKSHAVRVGSSSVTGDILIKNNTLRTLDQSDTPYIDSKSPASLNSAHGTIVLRNAEAKYTLENVVIADNILYGATTTGTVKLINNVSTSVTGLTASNNYWGSEGGISLRHNLPLSAVSPYYASLSADGTIDEKSLVTPLVPGQDVTGATWGGDATNGYTLAIGKGGSYKLTEPCTLKKLTVSADDVALSGSYPQNNAPTLTLNAAKGDTAAISTTKKNLTLQNLYITATSGANFGTAIKLGENGVLKNSRLDLTNLNTESTSEGKRLSSVAVSAGKNVLIDNTYIQAGNSETSSSQCVVISGSGAKITNNELYPGKGAVWVTDQSRPSTGSVAIRLTGAATDATITGNTILSTYSGTETSMNTGIGLDSVSGATTVTATNNKFTLSSASRADSGNNPGTGGFGNVFYLNPNSNDLTLTINANGNTVKGGTYFIFADKETATSVTIAGKIEKNSYGEITGKRLGNATGIAVTSSGLTWENNVEPAVPDVPSVTPTTDPSTGNFVVAPSNSADTAISGTTATIGDSATSAAVIQISGEGVTRNDDTGAITAPPTAEIKAAYNPAPAAVSPALAGAGTVTYQLNIVLTGADALGGLQLPTISPAHDETKARAVPSGYTVAAMITATNAAGTGINEKVQAGGVRLTFTVPAAWIDAIGEARVSGFHIGADNKATPVTTTILGRDGDTVKIQITGDGFSTYALAGYTSSEPPTSPPSSSSGNSENSFRVIFSTDGSNAGTVVAGLSYGDRVTKPADPTKDGYTFDGWYRNTAYTIPWDFAVDAVPGDTVLYAKWISGNAVVTTTATPTNAATVSATAKQTSPTAAPTGTAAATTAQSGTSPTMTQAPAPVFGMLAGLLAAGVLLRRRA